MQNRVNEIRRHCFGKANPANILSRCMSPIELSVNLMWRDGPDWSIKSEEKGIELQMPEDCITGVKKKDKGVIHNLLAVGELYGIE